MAIARQPVALVTDSTAGVAGLDASAAWHTVPLELEISGQRYREGANLSATDVHRLLQEANTPPVTLPPPIEVFADCFERLLATHDRVLSIHLSAALSDTVEHARAAARRLGGEERIVVFDSRLAGPALGLLCLEASHLLQRGEPLDRLPLLLEPLIAAMRVYFSVYTLDYLYLGGRLTRQARGSAPPAADRPILTLQGGHLELLERVEGEITRVLRTLELLDATFGPTEPLVAVCAHAGPRGEHAADLLAAHLTAAGRTHPCYRASLSPVLCAHTGFDVCGVAVYPRRLSAL